ncbi:MAG TPA: asparagine synthase (glutamine-hydrolyzing) [Thiotrichales bacterium]|nr:asparagine synthase (glutamine-hydrolyzing) [Thiotrichales bacterium]
MCGIAGIIATPAGEIDPARLERALERLAHRGPDHRGSHSEGGVALGHTRLSIIDLEGGDQPLFSADRHLVLVANGEIYNHVELREELEARGHRFSSRSDCETILHAYREYGEAFLEHLHGMFAFALWDGERQRMILARDRLGMKPLFLHASPTGIRFASELKGLLPLLDHTPDIHPGALIQYLSRQFSSGTTTIFQGIERLLPAEAVCIEGGRITRRWRYWCATAVEPSSAGLEEAREEFDAIMERVMVEHMRSDVPFGLFLSGGVDSAILLAMLEHHGAGPIHTWSVGFADDDRDSELPAARRLAERFGTRHEVLELERDQVFGVLAHTVWAADELMLDYANLPTALLAHAAARRLKVVFSGEGGDEVFAGYRRYGVHPLERRLKALFHPGSGGFRIRGYLRRRWRRHLPLPALAEHVEMERLPVINAWQETPARWSDLQRMQYVDLVTALPDNLLVKNDRMLMASGMEGRLPFVDHRVVEFGLGLPDALKRDAGGGKRFLKWWAERWLPRDHLNAPKRGFHVPVGTWLTPDLMDRLAGRLPAHPAITPWFEGGVVRELLDNARRRNSPNRIVWALLQLAIWHELFIEGDGSPPPVDCDPLELISA